MFEIKKESLDFGIFREKIKIAMISDIHINGDESKKLLNKAIKDINKRFVNFVFLLGDYIYDSSQKLKALDILGKIKSKNGIFAVIGNHDYGMFFKSSKPDVHLAHRIMKKLKQLKIKVLRNESCLIDMGKDKVNILGVDDFWYGHINLRKTFSKTDRKYPRFLLSHNPDAVLLMKRKYKTNLIFSGHTHGYTIRLPLIGAISSLFHTKLGRAYDKGFKYYKKRLMYITSGFGDTNIIPGAPSFPRIFNPPEIVFLDINS